VGKNVTERVFSLTNGGLNRAICVCVGRRRLVSGLFYPAPAACSLLKPGVVGKSDEFSVFERIEPGNPLGQSR
jgi:hypothetical protein